MKDWIKNPWIWLGVWVHVGAAWFSVGWQHADEHFQLIEFARYGLGLTSENTLPWEFKAQIRPTIQVFLSMLILKAGYGLGISDPFTLAFFHRLFITIGALFAIFWVHLQLKPFLKNATEPSLFLSLLGWGLVYCHVRFSSENASGLALFLSIPLLMRPGNHWQWLWGGILFGLAFALRFQSGFFLLGWGLGFLVSPVFSWHRFFWLALGFLSISGIAIALDSWFYGQFILTSYAYFDYNILKGVAAQFGREPWYWYIQQIVERLVPPFSLAVFPALFFMVKNKPFRAFGLGILFFVIGHSWVSHKEWRFLFPMAYFLPLGCGLWYRTWVKVAVGKWPSLLFRNSIILFWIVNSILTIPVAFRPASEVVSLYRFLYQLPPSTHVYYETENPFYSGSNLAGFYLPPNMQLSNWPPDTISQPGSKLTSVVLIHQGNPLEKTPTWQEHVAEPIYQTFPNWLYRYIGPWLKRSSQYTVYAWGQKEEHLEQKNKKE